MLNQVIFVGRLVETPTKKTTENGKEVANITLAVPRSYKNEDGEYDADFIDCVLWNGVASNTVEYCRKGDLIGIKGRMETNLYENENGEKIKSTQVVADKVTFLTSSKSKEQENVQDQEVEMDV